MAYWKYAGLEPETQCLTSIHVFTCGSMTTQCHVAPLVDEMMPATSVEIRTGVSYDEVEWQDVKPLSQIVQEANWCIIYIYWRTPLPPEIQKNVPISGAMDNFDHNEHVLSERVPDIVLVIFQNKTDEVCVAADVSHPSHQHNPAQPNFGTLLKMTGKNYCLACRKPFL